MTRKNKCVECRHCRTVVDPKKGTRHYCSRKKQELPADVGSRPACEEFELPKAAAHWGP